VSDPGHGLSARVEQKDSWIVMPVVTRLSPEQAATAEREYVAHRDAVLRMLRREFPRMHNELEELYQQAWIEFLELRASGAEIDNPRALLQKIAWRSARARLRRKKPQLLEPSSETLVFAPDSAPLPDEVAQVHIDADRLRAVVESLDERQAAAIKLRFDCGLSSKEIQRSLGVTPKRLEKIVTDAYAALAEQLQLMEDGETPWLRRQRSLLLACEIGLASARQRRRAQRVVEADPACRAMLAEMRRTLHDAAALLPVPAVTAPERSELAVHSFLDRMSDLWSSVRHAPSEAVQRLAPASSSAEQAGSAAGAALGVGATAKIVAACIAAGGTAALCVEGVGRFGEDRPVRTQARPAPQRTDKPSKPTRSPAPRTAPAKKASTKPTAKRPPTTRKRTPPPVQKSAVPISSPSAVAPASPAPEGSTEFGPGAIGSSAAPSVPAAAPADGGGEFTP